MHKVAAKYRITLIKLKILIKNKIYNDDVKIHIGKGVKIGQDVMLRIGPHSNIFIGDNVHIGRGCIIELEEGASLSIGKNVYLYGYDIITCMSSVIIGDDTIIAEFVSIRDVNHKYRDITKCIASQGFSIAPVVISEDVWIGRGCVILKGVSLGKHSVIGANSVVNKDIPPYSVAVGSPAKVIKKYDFEILSWTVPASESPQRRRNYLGREDT